jgi:HPr kinase/phosphorylase
MEFERKAGIAEFKTYFNLEQIAGNEEALNRWAIVPDINRPGLELAGYFEHSEPRRIIVMGTKEISYIKKVGEASLRDHFERLTDEFSPAIVISKNLECPQTLRDIANRKNFPIFVSSLPTYRLMVDIVSYLDEQLAPMDNLHGVLLSVYGKGVIIAGDSGVGKSETALELIRRGHLLVADDRVDVRRVHNSLFGQAPDLLRGMLEIRGIGIIDVAKMFGASALMHQSPVEFIINLEKWADDKAYARVGIEEETFETILELKVPQITIPVKDGRNIAFLVETAVTNFSLKQMGINSAKEFEQRVYAYIQSQNTKEST